MAPSLSLEAWFSLFCWTRCEVYVAKGNFLLKHEFATSSLAECCMALLSETCYGMISLIKEIDFHQRSSCTRSRGLL